MHTDYRAIAMGLFAAAIFCLILLFTGCALTYPTKAGDVTLSFQPPPELISQYGGYLFNSPTRRDK
jgi:hypothetical protein